eukprot:GGOE01036275.1.p1 GENE.GGOE01036275.1~~GGOE01036275.1.p1  ORF type:complete len:740 (+),score=209.66 GGOE01036275.1:167-2221(+)
MAQQVRAEKKWRFKYTKYLVDQVEASLKSPDAALKVAEAGLSYLHNVMEFIRDDKALPLAQAMAQFTTGSFETGVVQGTEQNPKFEAEIPYKGKVLRGDALKVQVDKWVRAGVIETSCGQAISQVADMPNWLTLTGNVFVMLGASSAMGPFPMLMSLGATVVAVDIDRPAVWKKLIATCRQSSGRLIIPLKKPQSACANDDELAEAAGCNLMTQTPEIRNWLLKQEPGKPMVVGAYAYLDGPLFLKISIAMDSIIADLVKQRKATPAYLCTPTDAHVVPAAAMEHSSNILRVSPLWQQLLAIVLKGPKAMRPNKRKPVTAENGEQFYVCDAIVPDQGPNYILAKRLQHWRAILARANGCKASSNIAPSTATVSVVSNKSFALAYKGMHNFRPVEVFEQETSSAVMGLLLINDIKNENSVANPATPLRNPLLLFSETSFHGGAWRCGYKFGSIGIGSVLSAVFSNYIVRAYLTLYNAGQAAGWSVALGQILAHAASGSRSPLWGAVGPTIGTFQWLAVLEVVHAVLGMVRSPAATTFVQVLSRVMLVSAVQYAPSTQGNDNAFLWLMCLAWSITEVVRYSYYGLGQLGLDNKLLTWLRYSLFLVLYPAGVAGEMGCLYKSIPAMKDTPPADAPVLVKHMLQPMLKNSLGYLLFIVPVYVVGLKTLYSYMLAQRKKIFGGAEKKSQ